MYKKDMNQKYPNVQQVLTTNVIGMGTGIIPHISLNKYNRFLGAPSSPHPTHRDAQPYLLLTF